MKHLGLILSIASCFIGAVFALISTLPLAWVGPNTLPDNIAKMARFHGTIWQGQTHVPYGGSHLIITSKASALKLISGQIFSEISVQNEGMDIRGFAGFNKAENIKAEIDFAYLPLLNPRIRGLQGLIDIELSDVKFKDKCTFISGTMRTNFLNANERTWYWAGPDLTGPIDCDDGDVTINLSGQDQNQSFTAKIIFLADGIYKSEMRVDTNDSRAAVVLSFYGFEKRDQQFVLSETGYWY